MSQDLRLHDLEMNKEIIASNGKVTSNPSVQVPKYCLSPTYKVCIFISPLGSRPCFVFVLAHGSIFLYELKVVNFLSPTSINESFMKVLTFALLTDILLQINNIC